MNNIIDDINDLLSYVDNFNYEKVFILGYYNVGVEQEYINYIKKCVKKQGFLLLDKKVYIFNIYY